MDKERIEHIEKYLSGKLTPEERKRFEEALEQDNLLQEQVAERVIEYAGRLDLKKQLQEIDQTIAFPSKPNYVLLKVAASVVLLIGIAFYVFQRNNQPIEVISQYPPKDSINKEADTVNRIREHMPEDPARQEDPVQIAMNEVKSGTELYANYFETYPTPHYRGGETLVIQAFEAYNAKQFNEAIHLFDQSLDQLEQAEDIDQVLFYTALSQLNLNDSITFNKAEKNLNALYMDTISAYRSQARWYLALLAVNKGEKESVIRLLNETVQTKEFNAARAEELLKELNLWSKP